MDEAGAIFRTYSTYARGIDVFNTACDVLDCVPKGRDEDGREPPVLGATNTADEFRCEGFDL